MSSDANVDASDAAGDMEYRIAASELGSSILWLLDDKDDGMIDGDLCS